MNVRFLGTALLIYGEVFFPYFDTKRRLHGSKVFHLKENTIKILIQNATIDY